jgi:hypothetical protein
MKELGSRERTIPRTHVSRKRETKGIQYPMSRKDKLNKPLVAETSERVFFVNLRIPNKWIFKKIRTYFEE